MTKSRTEKLGFNSTVSDIRIYLKDKLYDDAKMYIRQMLRRLPAKKACEEMTVLIEQIEEQKELAESIEMSDRVILFMSAVKEGNKTIVDFFLKNQLIENISEDDFIQIVLNCFSKGVPAYIERILHARRKIADSHISHTMNKILLRYLKEHSPVDLQVFWVLYHNGADPIGDLGKDSPIQTAIQMGNKNASTFFLHHLFLDPLSAKQLKIIFEILLKEGWLVEAGMMFVSHHRKILQQLSEIERDSALFVFANALHDLKDINNFVVIEEAIELFVKAEANPFQLFSVAGHDLSAFECMGYSWDSLLRNVKSFHEYTPKELAFALLILVNSREKDRELLIQNILKNKKEMLNEFYKDKVVDVNYLLYKMTKDKIIDDEKAEILFELGAHPFGGDVVSDIFHTTFGLALFYKNALLLELMLERFLKDFNAFQLADIYKIAVENEWKNVKVMIASGKNNKKDQMAYELSDALLTKFISDVVQDEKPDEQFLIAICPDKRINPDHKGGSILEYAMIHHHDVIMELILSNHGSQLSCTRFCAAIQSLYLSESYEKHDFKLLIYIDKLVMQEKFKRETLNKLLIQQVHKAKKITDVMSIIEFIDRDQHLFPFMRNGAFWNDWKNIRSEAVCQIKKIAKSSNRIDFQNNAQVEAVKVFLKKESGCGLFQNEKRCYEQLIKNKIHICEVRREYSVSYS